MIPSVSGFLDQEFEVEEEPSKNYRMDIYGETICGKIDGLEAMKQVIYKILNTERYQHIIYSWNYGVELEDLYGEPSSYVCPELERRITEALVQDDRIKSVDEFAFEIDRHAVTVSFTVHTVFGDIQTEKEVDV